MGDGLGKLFKNGKAYFCGNFHEGNFEGNGIMCINNKECCNIENLDNENEEEKPKIKYNQDCNVLNYAGEFKNNTFHGKGKYCKKKNLEDGNFENGNIIKNKGGCLII